LDRRQRGRGRAVERTDAIGPYGRRDNERLCVVDRHRIKGISRALDERRGALDEIQDVDGGPGVVLDRAVNQWRRFSMNSSGWSPVASSRQQSPAAAGLTLSIRFRAT